MVRLNFVDSWKQVIVELCKENNKKLSFITMLYRLERLEFIHTRYDVE